MKFSVNWLREFVELPPSIDALAELLTMSGVEIEAIEKRGADFDCVVVAQIIESKPHPNADRLTVCVVDDGNGTKRQIVCGAKNYKVDDKVPLALPGAELTGGLKIRASKLRGVESEGMLCSAKELGVAEDAAGLLILLPNAKIGAPIRDLFLPDTILDVEITPNRGDLLSHFGLAREIAALTNKRFVGQALRLPSKAVGNAPALQRKGITISALRECPFYSARRIENVKVGPSPDWLRAKIESVGIRSINNVVDVSNFVLLELGQPTHAFDADKLSGAINVRLAQEGEKFLALDGKTYALTPENLVIADDERAVGIAGVMGGEESGVTKSTRNVLLESAYFLPASIRRTARELNLPSDASYRFERGVDPEMVHRASQRVTELIQEIAGGTPAKEINVAGKLPANPADVSLRYEKCDCVVGIAIKPKTVDEVLTRFGLKKISAAEITKWKIPSFRPDLQRDVDLIEEAVRAYGAERIPGTDCSRFTPSSAADRAHDLELQMRQRLIATGLNEVRTSKLLARERLAFGENAIELRNPLSKDHVALRPSLLPGLLGVLDHNIRAGAEGVAIFDSGRIFEPPSGAEKKRVAVLLWGNVGSEVHWRNEKRRVDFFDLKGAIEQARTGLSFRRGQHANFALAVEIAAGNQLVGLAGQLTNSLASTIDASGGVFVAEVSLDFPVSGLGSRATFRELGKFPAMSRDIAMIVAEDLTHEKIREVIFHSTEPLLERVEFFDLFAGTEIGEGKKSLAYRLTYRDRSRTLTSEEVNAAHAKIRERLRSDLGAELRE